MTSEKIWNAKYRPRNMQEFKGENIRNIISSHFNEKDNFPKVVLLHGDRGVGKTSLARILSKYILCTNVNDDNTCEQCENCKLLNSLIVGDCSPNDVITEIDATTILHKERLYELVDRITKNNTEVNKVIIIDECQMFSFVLQSYLLRILEEMPLNLTIILVATDIENILNTVIDRCDLVLEVVKPNANEISNRLIDICLSEDIVISQEAIDLIIKSTDKNFRECITILQVLANAYGKNITLDNLHEYLN